MLCTNQYTDVFQVVQFLTKLAESFDLNSVEFAPGGELQKEDQDGPTFVPMRRKLQVQ